MQQVKITSIYGKTMEFKNDDMERDRFQVTVRDEGGEFVRNAIFDLANIEKLRAALTPEPTAKGTFFILRQKKEDARKVKVCFAGVTHTKEYTNRADAQAAVKRLNEQYKSWNYFVVEKETV